MINAQLDLATDPQWKASEHVQGVNDSSVSAVFDRYDAEFGVPSVHFLKDRSDGTDVNQIGSFAKPLDRGLVRVAESRSQVGNPLHANFAASPAENVPHDATDGQCRKRAGVFSQHPSDGFVLKLRREKDLPCIIVRFDPVDRELSPLINQLQNLKVQLRGGRLNLLRRFC